MPKRKTRPQPNPGSTFPKKYRGREYILKVIRKDGTVRFELNGVLYRSPSAAAKSITKNEVNGWKFWRID